MRTLQQVVSLRSSVSPFAFVKQVVHPPGVGADAGPGPALPRRGVSVTELVCFPLRQDYGVILTVPSVSARSWCGAETTLDLPAGTEEASTARL